MALNLERFDEITDADRAQRRAEEAARAVEENQRAWEEKPFYERLAEGTIAEAAGNAFRDVMDTAITKGGALIDAASREWDVSMGLMAGGTKAPGLDPAYRAAHEETSEAAVDFAVSVGGKTADYATRPARYAVGAYIHQKAEEGSAFAQDIRATDTVVRYLTSPEEKLKKAREIEARTGISADAVVSDDTAYKEALKIDDYLRRKEAIMPEGAALEALWIEYPELRGIAERSREEAALALHDIESVRTTHGIVETFTHFLAVGNKELEYNNIQYRIGLGMADEDDIARADQLKMMIDDEKKKMPAFLDDPLAKAIGEMASSAPEMWQGIREGAIYAAVSIGAGAAMGSAVPVVGTGAGALGGTALGIGGAVAGQIARRTLINRAVGMAARAAMRPGTWAGVGMFEGLRRPETGARYAEYGEMVDKDGRPLFRGRENERRFYSLLGGAANAGIETVSLGIEAQPLRRGFSLLSKESYAKSAVRDVVSAARSDVAQRESLAAFAKTHLKDTLKVAGTESAEEASQSLADDLIHNCIVVASGGRARDEEYSIGDMTANALIAGLEAFPAGLGFGVLSSAGGASIGSVRHAQRLFSERAQQRLTAERTMTGTVMLERLQQVASSAKLKETAPDVQQKIIHAQVKGTGFETAYIDTETALKEEKGYEDLKAVAKAAGIEEAELQKTIEARGRLAVPVEKYAQSAASPQLLRSVSFTAETDSMARMKENAQVLSAAMETAAKEAVRARTEIVHAIANEWFPEAPAHASEEERARRSAEREMAVAAIVQNESAPAAGWRALHKEFTAARDEILRPATDALSRGMKQGVDILQNGEDGRGIRVSNNAPWYQAYYKEHGKAPNQEELRELAYLLTVGDASAPEVEGWLPTSKDAAEAMAAAKGELDELNAHIRTLGNIKERMMKVDAAEVRGTAGLSPEGYSVYRRIMGALEAFGGRQRRTARMNALLFAHHADIYAKAIRTKKGMEQYTAMDYFKEKFALRDGRKGVQERADILHQAAMKRSDARSLAAFSRQMYSPEVGTGSRKKVFLQITASSGAFVDVAQDDMIHMHNYHPEMTDDDFAAIQENMENFLCVHQDKTGKGDYGGETILCKIKTPRGVAGVSYELLPTGRIFLKTAFFDDEKGIDNWITKNGTGKDLMDVGTEKRGNAVSMLPGHPSRTADAADSLTPSDVQPLSLSMIQKRLGIVNEKEQFAQSATDVPSAEKDTVRKQYEGTAQWMKAPNGEATNLTEDQWLTVRTPAFKAWFGDWEAEAEKQKYLNTEPIEVAEKKIMKSEGVTAMRAALQWAEQHLPVQVMTRFGEVEINRASIKDSLGHGYSQKKLDAITSLPEGMMVAAFIGETKDFDGADIDNGYFCYPMMYQGENQVVFCRVRRDMNSNKLYVHEVFTEDEIKDIPLQAAAKFLNSKPHGGNALYKSILTDFLNKDNTVSKVVDENGEPLVVYHQTSNMFDSFDVRHEGAGRNDSETPYGIFLKPNADDIGFGDIQMPLFARVCNPLRFNNREQLAHWAKKEVEGYADLAERLQSLDTVYKKRSDVAEQQENKLYEEMWNAQERGELSDEEYEAKAAELEEHGEWERILKEWQETTAAVRHDMKELLDAVVRSSGYDGFLLDTDAGAFGRKVPTIVALTPWQVKSATDNNGAFLADDANIYHQSAWHGSPYDFRAFLLEMIGAGAGAQAHGWGVYLAQNKDLPEEYRRQLTAFVYEPGWTEEQMSAALKEQIAACKAEIESTEKLVDGYKEVLNTFAANRKGTLENLYQTVSSADAKDILQELITLYDGSASLRMDEARRLVGDMGAREHQLEQVRRRLRQLKLINPNKIKEIVERGFLYHVEIPENDVLLDEQKPYTKQPIKVRKGLDTLLNDLTIDQLENWGDVQRLGKNKIITEIKESFSKTDGGKIYGAIDNLVGGQEAASRLLNEYGIKGITYNEQNYGRCFVIFDDKAISIIEKFNQMLRQEVRGEISKEDGKRIITLFESADESTFMHEMGHMFLMDLDELAKMDEASAKDLETVNAWAEWHEGAAEEYEDTPWAEEFRAHEEAIRKAVAAGDVIAEKAARERWRQERFARGFELFLTEGKAPSHALRGVFRKFKEYLRKIYHFVRSVGGHPSPEVQAVMALMIATEDEIKAASLDALYRPMEGLGGKEGIKTLLGETEAETYERWLKEAQEEAEDILRARVMKDLKKEARAEVRERLDAERERKRAELENDPVHLAAAAIQAAGSEDVALNWFPSLEAYKKAHAERKPLETELAEHMEDYAKKIDTEIMTSHLTEESIVRAMQTPKAYHRRIAIEMAALRRRERMMQKVGGKEQDVHADAVAVRGDEFGAYKHIKELRDRAIAYYRNVLQGTSVENVHLGKVDIDENGLVEFTGSGRREAKSTSAKPEKLLLIKYLPKLIRGATNITENAAQKESHAGEYFYYLHTNASVDGTTVPVVITLIKRNDGSIQYYNHTLPSLEESIKKEPPVSAGPVSSNEALGTPPVGDSVVSTIPQRNMVGQVSASGVRRASPEEIRKEYERAAEENVRVLREEAYLYLADRPISESCSPLYYRRKERQHARDAAKAAAAGEWSRALGEKQQQAFAAACAYVAEQNERKLDALKKGVQKKLGARTVRIAASERYWLHHIAYLLGLKADDAIKPEDCTPLAKLFRGYAEMNDIDACDPSEFLERFTEGQKTYKAMPLREFAETVNAMNILYTVGRDHSRMKSIKGKTVEEVIDAIMTDASALRPASPVEHPISPNMGGVGYSELLAKVPKLGTVLAELVQKGEMLLVKPEILLRLLGETAHKTLYGLYERAQMAESTRLAEAYEALEQIFAVYPKKERMTWKDRKINGYGDMLSKENVFAIALNWGADSNRRRILDGVGQTVDVQRVLEENMTAQDWQAVQKVWDLIDTFWEESAKTEEELNGARLGKVPAAAVHIMAADGTEVNLRGGYYPIRYNAEKSSRAQDKTVEEEAKGRMTGAQVFGTKRGHTKARSEKDVAMPVRLEFSVLQEHLYNAVHNITFRTAARDVYRVINSKAFEEYVCAAYGRPVHDALKKWAVDVWAIPPDGTDAAADGVSRMMAALRRNSTMAIMGWRIWPVMENVSNIAPVMDRLGARRALAAIWQFVSRPKDLIDQSRRSIFMAHRMDNMERDLRSDTHLFDPTYRPVEFLRDNAYRALSYTDLALSIPTWYAVYEEAFPEAMAEISRENEENRRTQQEAEERVSELRAALYDLRRERDGVREEQTARRYRSPMSMDRGRYGAMPDDVFHAEDARLSEVYKAKEKEFYEAGLAAERAGELKIYDEAERIREAEVRAVQAADAAVRDTFGSGQTKDLAAIQRSRDELVKMFTSFYSFFNTQFNAVLESHCHGKYAVGGYRCMRVWMPLARSMLCRVVLVGIIGAALKFSFGLEGDDEKEKFQRAKDAETGETVKVEIPWEERFAKVLGRNMLSTGAGMLPFVRDAAGAIGALVFDGTMYGRSLEIGGVATRGAKQVAATVELFVKKGERDLKRAEKEMKEVERVAKMTKAQRAKYEEDKRYKKPEKEIGGIDLAQSAAQALSSLTAARTGVTNTVADALFRTLQYVEDVSESDNYYDPDVRNWLRSVIFDKKLRKREVPERPPTPKKERRGGKWRSRRHDVRDGSPTVTEEADE